MLGKDLGGSMRRKFRDTYAIYYSAADKRWIAHSLRTDQMGTGNCILDALVDGLRAIDQVLDYADKHPGTKVLTPAPPEIFALAKDANRLPEELADIAHKTLYGEWPDAIKPSFEVDENEVFKQSVWETSPA